MIYQLRKNSLVIYVLTVFGFFTGRDGSVVVRKRDKDMKGSGSRSGFGPSLLFSFFSIETLSITDQKFSESFKNGSDRLRKGTTAAGAVKITYYYDPYFLTIIVNHIIFVGCVNSSQRHS